MTRVLVLSPWSPYPGDFGGRLRVLSLVRALAADERRQVELLAFADSAAEARTAADYLLPFGIRAHFVVHPTRLGSRLAELPNRFRAARRRIPFNAQLYWHRQMSEAVATRLRDRPCDMVVAETSWMGQYVRAARATKVLSWQNLDFDVYARRAIGDRNPLTWAVRKYNHAVALRFELDLARCFDALLTVTDADRDRIAEQLKGSVAVHTVPISVDTDRLRPDRGRDGATILFVGAMFYQPNIDAVTFFHRDIYPIVRRRIPDVHFVIAGRDPAAAVRALASADRSVTVTGTVGELTEYYEQATVLVAPIRFGGGMKTKIVEAMANGVPVVASSFAAEGLSATPGETILLEDDSARFADAVVELLTNPERRRQMAFAGRSLIEAHYSWQSLRDRLAEILDRLPGA